ncbi:hypothetical protein ACFE04_011953 [Oxalis oulophora]
MGAVCSGGMIVNEDGKVNNNNNNNNNKRLDFSTKLRSNKSLTKKNSNRKNKDTTNVYSNDHVHNNNNNNNNNGSHQMLHHQRYDSANSYYDSGDLFLSSFSRELKPSTTRTSPNKGMHKSSFLGRASLVGLEVLDTLGSSMTNLNAGSGFISGMAARGNKIFILAFEVANTIAKGTKLLQSLSEENIQFLKDVLHSEGVQQLVSTDMNELLSIAASDKREELGLFSREVIRFGNLCKDPQWHNLGRYFSKLDSEYSTEQQKEEAEKSMHDLTTLAQHTSELYHELHALDRFEQDYQRKLEEIESLNLPRKGDCLTMLQSELKQQRKIVRTLKKKSLWSKNLEEIIEKLVDIVTYIDQSITVAFGNSATKSSSGPPKSAQSLGAAGLALHYANLINQIDNIASRPTTLPPNMRDSLYNGLPTSVKKALRSKMRTIDTKEELLVSQVKNEMEKTLHWLVPVATNTTKAHQGFGWVGEWANTGHEFGKSTTANISLTRIQTLYHADKKKMDEYILELITWLHRLISLVRHRDHGFMTLPIQSKGMVFNPKKKEFLLVPDERNKPKKVQLSEDDKILLANVCKRRIVSGLSKSQEFEITGKRGKKVGSLSTSAGNSPVSVLNKRRNSLETNLLDIMDGLDCNSPSP